MKRVLIIISFLNTLSSLAQSPGDYRSRQNGAWNAAASWQTYDGTNWINTAAAPSASNGIITILSSHVITASSAITADQLVINSGGTLSITSGTFTVNDTVGNDLDCDGTLALSGGTLTGAGMVSVNTNGTFNWTGGVNGGTGVMNIGAGAVCTINGNVLLGDTKTFNNSGTWNWTSGIFYYNNGSPVVNNAGTFNINTDADLIRNNTTTGVFNNTATGVINKTGSPNEETTFNNFNAFNNAGTVNILSSRLRVYVNSVQTGKINIAFGAGMLFSGGVSYFNTGANFTGAGSLSFEAGNDTINAATVSVSNINVTGATVYVAPSITMDNGSVFNLSSGTLTGPGTITMAAGSTFNWSGGYNGGTGVMNINQGAVMNSSGSGVAMADTKTLNNAGTWNWTSGPFYYNNGSPVVNNSGTFNIVGDNDVTRISANTGTFNNLPAGIINKTGAPDGETYFNNIGSFSNAGKINVNAGLLRIYINSTHIGTITVAFGANMCFNTGTAMFNAGTLFSGAGNLNFESGNDTINAAAVSVGNINLSGANVYAVPTIAVGSGSVLSLSSGTLVGPGTININSGGTFNWSGGFNGGSGTMNIATGAVCNVTNGVNFSDTKTINNAGTWNWTGGTFYYYNGAPVFNNAGIFNISTDAEITRSNVNTGVFNNLPTGVINKSGSPNDETSLSNIGSFSNAGTINVLSSALRMNVNSIQSGTANISFGANMIFNSGRALFNAGTSFTGGGNLIFESGNDTINAATVSVSNINISGAAVYLAPAVTMGSGSILNLSSGTLAGPGTITMSPGSTFNWSGGFNGGSGVMNIARGGVCNMTNGVNFSDTKTINNAGTWNWTGGNFYYNNGSPVFNNSGVFNIATDGDINQNSANTGVFNNLQTGIINKTGSPSDETSFNNISAFNNAGAVNINSSNIRLNVGGIHSGTYKVAYGAQLSGSLNMSFTGAAFINDGNVALTGLSFNGAAVQSLNGEGSVNSLTISNASGVTLGGSQTVNGALNLGNGKITIGDNNLIVAPAATFTGGSATAYVVTNGLGSFQRRVPNNNTATLFPVGFSTAYMPVGIQLTAASVADNFSVRLQPNLYGGYDTTSGNTVGGGINAYSVNASWFITEAVPGGSNATVTFQWQGGNEATGFNRTVSRFAQYRSGAWNLDAATVPASGANPYSFARSGLTSFSVFGITNQFVTSMNNFVTFCSGNAVNIPYNAIGTFSAGNVFTAQLSDSTGSYAAPVSIGSVTATASGSINASIPGATLTGTGYRIRIVSTAPGMVSPDNPSIIPIRACAAAPPVLTKNVPVKVNITNITFNGAVASWDKVSSANSYEVEFREASATGWNTMQVPSENLSMNMLQPNTRYEVKVRSVTGADYSDFSEGKGFKTLGVEAAAVDIPGGKLTVYPNPTSGRFTIKLSVKELTTGRALLQIFNTAGQVVHTESMAVSGYELNKTMDFHPANSGSGLYFIRLQAGNRLYYSKIHYQK